MQAVLCCGFTVMVAAGDVHQVAHSHHEIMIVLELGFCSTVKTSAFCFQLMTSLLLLQAAHRAKWQAIPSQQRSIGFSHPSHIPQQVCTSPVATSLNKLLDLNFLGHDESQHKSFICG